MATLKKIAGLAKVSIATVSRTLNFDNTLSISDVKKKRIFEIADELEYKTPRRKKLESAPKLNIALIYWYTLVQELEDPYYLSIRRGIERCSFEKGVNIIKIPKSGSNFLFDAFPNIDGIIAVGKFANSEIRNFGEITKNIVFVDFSSFEGNYDSIVIDFQKSMDQVLNHIVFEKGYSNVGYLGGREYVHNKDIVIGVFCGVYEETWVV
jgi:LacI family transcriptional regulator